MHIDNETSQWIVIIIAQAGVMVLGFSLLIIAMSLCRTLSVLASRLRTMQSRLVKLEKAEGLRNKLTRTESPPHP